MNSRRRRLLKYTLATGFLGTLFSLPMAAFASWPRRAFQAKKLSAVLEALTGNHDFVEDRENITIEAPAVADNRDKIPVRIETRLAEVQSIILMIPDAPSPLVARFHLSPGVKGSVATNIRMNKTGDLMAVIQAGNKLFATRRRINVIAEKKGAGAQRSFDLLA